MAAPPSFDPTIIQQHARKLYQIADGMALGTALSHGVVGALIGAVVALLVGDLSYWIGGAVGGAIGVISGYEAGHRKGFELRLQAQMALCQMQIEENTARQPVVSQELGASSPATGGRRLPRV